MAATRLLQPHTPMHTHYEHEMAYVRRGVARVSLHFVWPPMTK